MARNNQRRRLRVQPAHRRKSPAQRTAVALVILIVIAVATVSTASTWFFLTHQAATSTTSELNATPRAYQSAGLNATYVYANSRQGVVLVVGMQTTQTAYGPDTSAILGSGFIINSNGTDYVITNFHVVDGTKNLTVTFYDGNAYAAKVVGDDPYSDFAVLSVSGAAESEFHPLDIAPSGSLIVGEPVLAIGNPYGLAGSVTIGIISQLGRTIQETAAGNFSIAGMIQFSAPINPGNSGGPLLNGEGQVVGITTAVVSYSQGVGFAVPSDTITRELPYLVKTGSYDLHPYLGILGADMNYPLAQALGTNVTYGVLVQKVIQGGPAAGAGIRGGTRTATILGQDYVIGGDIIVSINGRKILSNDDLATYLEENETAGMKVLVGIVRSGTLTYMSIVLGARPAPPPSS
jgi:S1-C subfamily serine protease